MHRVTVAALVLVTACGRLGFGGSTARDAPASDVRADGAGDAPPDAAPACLPSYRLCDGFEGASFDPAWSIDIGVTLDTTVAHRGASSAHVQSTALAVNTGGYFNLLETKSLAFGDPTLYVRAYVRMSALPAGSNGWELMVAEQVGGTVYGDYVFVKNAHFTLYTQFSGQATNEATSPPLDTWQCLLWSVTRATTNTGAMTLAGDPAPISLSNVTTDGTSPQVTRMAYGIGFAGTNVTTAQPPIDLWIDDLIVSPTPVTCADSSPISRRA